MELSQLRREIDAIDAELVKLFCDRMELSAKVADYKKANNLPIHHPVREQEILETIGQQSSPNLAEYVKDLYRAIFAISRDYQTKRNSEVSE